MNMPYWNWTYLTHPRKLLIWIWAVSALMLFSPARVIERFGLTDLIAEISPLLGIMFFLVSAIFLCETFSELIAAIAKRIRAKEIKQEINEKIAILDHQERAILREFFIQRRSTIVLPTNEPAVRALLEAHVLQRTPTPDERSEDRFQGFSLHQWAKPKLTSRLLQLPVGDMTEEQIQYLKQTRPDFVIKDMRLRRRRIAA
jgi:hypothetical protein